MQIRHIIFFIFVASAIYVYYRGRVRFGVVRSLTDYQVLLAPVNTLLYLFSKVKASAYIQLPSQPAITILALIRFSAPAGNAFICIGMGKIYLQHRRIAQKRLHC